MDGLWFILWTGCPWKVVYKTRVGVPSSVLHERFQTWQQQGIWEQNFRSLLRFYARKRHFQWKWQQVDSRSCIAPLGNTSDSPTDRAKHGSKNHHLVDQRGAPLSIWVTGANQHDKWSQDDLVIDIMVKQPTSDQKVERSNRSGGAIFGKFLGKRDSTQKSMCDGAFYQSHNILIKALQTLCD